MLTNHQQEAQNFTLLDGMSVRALTPHTDSRGWLVELTHDNWYQEAGAGQWNALSTRNNVLRGFQVHALRTDHLVLLQGRMTACFVDLRRQSPTWRKKLLLELEGDQPQVITLPPGIAHGFYFHEPSITMQMLSDRYDPKDEFHIHWRDSTLNIPWPTEINDPILSDNDKKLGKVEHLSLFSPLYSV